MADTGILLRGSTHEDIMADKPIHREVCVTEKGLVIGYDSGSGIDVKTLNLEVLAKIGKVAEDGAVEEGLKTSQIPIIFDGLGDIKVTDDFLTLRDSHKLSTTLRFIKSVSYNGITLTDLGDPETTRYVSWKALEAISGLASPELNLPTTTKVNIDQVVGTVEVVDEAELSLGTLTAIGELTFSTPQIVGAKIYAYNIDEHKNKSNRVSILIP